MLAVLILPHSKFANSKNIYNRRSSEKMTTESFQQNTREITEEEKEKLRLIALEYRNQGDNEFADAIELKLSKSTHWTLISYEDLPFLTRT